MGRMELSQRLDLAKLGLETSEPEDEADVSSGGSTLAQLTSLLQKVGAVEDAEAVGVNDTLDSLGVDSLTRIELAVRAEEHFGVRVDEETVGPGSSMGELAQFFDEKRGN